MEKLLIATVCLVLLGTALPARETDPAEWTWVLGRLDDEREDKKYQAFARRMHRGYQKREQLVGELVHEADLETLPASQVVFLGPLEAFEHREWMAPLLDDAQEHSFRVGEQTFGDERVGLFLRNVGQTRFIYTGTSLQGFKDIFATFTGRHACTITIDGRDRWEGEWRGETLELSTTPFLPLYPSAEEVAGLEDVPGSVESLAVYETPNHEAFTADFGERIERLIQGRDVLFVGESHWNVGVNGLFNGLLEFLLEERGVRAVFQEANYSYGAWYDHYVSLADDAEAEVFLREELHTLISNESQLVRLEILRAWNRENPDSRVRVASLDMEWGLDNVVRKVLAPYFKRLDPEFHVPNPHEVSDEVWNESVAQMERLLEEAEEAGTQGKYPFQTPDYYHSVLTNLADTLGINNFNVDRQRGILRNISEFNGELFDKSAGRDGLVMFKGGGFHAVKTKGLDPGFQREAAFLEHEFAPTKGKVATLMLQGLGVGFADIAPLDLNTRLGSATNYNNFVRDFQTELAAGFASEGDFYLLERGELSLADRVAVHAGYVSGRDILWIDSFDLETGVGGGGSHRLDEYDGLVYVLRSQLERTRARAFGEN